MTEPDVAAPPRPEVPSRPDLRTGLLIIVALILGVWALKAAAVVLIPVVTAILIALAVMPVRDWIRARVPGWASVLGVVGALGVVLLVLGVFFGGLYLAGRQLVAKVPEAAEQITGMMEAGGAEDATAREEGMGGTVVEGAQAGAERGGATGGEGATDDGEGGFAFPTNPREMLQRGGDQLLGAAGGAVSAIMNAGVAILGGLVLVFFLTLLLLLESGDWAKKTRRLVGSRTEWGLIEASEVVAAKFRAYVLLQAGFGLVTGTLYAVWLGFWGVDLILVWAILSFLMNFIPNLGSIIAGVTTTAYALVTKDLGTAAIVGAGILTIEQVMGNVVAPQLQGKNIALSPLVVLVALVFWGWAWGIAGALLAVPVTFALVVLMAHVPALRPWALLLTDQTDMAGLDEATTP